MKKAIIIIVALAALLATDVAIAATGTVRTKVYGVLTGSNRSYGGCMVQIAPISVDMSLNCKNQSDQRTWLTMDCNGTRLAPSVSSNNLKQAQLALLTKDTVTITVDDSFRAAGYCLGTQIIIFR